MDRLRLDLEYYWLNWSGSITLSIWNKENEANQPEDDGESNDGWDVFYGH